MRKYLSNSSFIRDNYVLSINTAQNLRNLESIILQHITQVRHVFPIKRDGRTTTCNRFRFAFTVGEAGKMCTHLI